MQWSACLLLCLLSILNTCSANFMFTFELGSISTLVNCGLGDQVCDTYLEIFCLRTPTAPQTSVTSGSQCPLGSSGRVDEDETMIRRTYPSSQPWPGGFQMYIRSYDDDPSPNPDDFLDDFFITLVLAPFTGFTTAMDYTGVFSSVRVNGMRFKVDCSPNFFGSDCRTECFDRDDDVNGHFTCNNDGSIQCRTGFENPANRCRDLITSCSADPCMNGGTCTPIGLENHNCTCVAGYTGENCEMEIDECQPEPCQNGGNCTDLVADYACACALGFEDRNCSTNIDECAGVECAGNKTCQDLINGFQCVCIPGFEGENCTEMVMDGCAVVICPENSQCVESTAVFQCVCNSGFEGENCTEVIVVVDGCEELNCPDSSQCVQSTAGFQCVCDEGFQGDTCSPTNSSQQRAGQTAVIAGAVAGSVGGLLILLILVVIVACIMVTRRSKNATTTTVKSDEDYVDVDYAVESNAEIELKVNPVYGVGSRNPTSSADVDFTSPNVSYSVFSSSGPHPNHGPIGSGDQDEHIYDN